MGKVQRIRSILSALFLILCACIMIRFPSEGVDLVVIFLAFSLSISALYTLGYYFTMARFMVDGQLVLIKGGYQLSFGLLMLTMIRSPRQYVMIYLLFYHGFNGLTGILHALESRQMQVKNWKLNFLMGCLDLSLSIVCIVFLNSANTMVYIYAFTLLSSAISKIVMATRRTAMVYIQ